MAKARQIENLDCAANFNEGARLVLETRLDETLGFRDAALDFSSDKGVHDMRVASRRLRSVARDFEPHLDLSRRQKRAFKKFVAEVKRLASALGSVRDADVQIGLLEEIRARVADAEIKAGIENFIASHKGRRAESQNQLSVALRDVRVDDLPRLLRNVFESHDAKEDESANVEVVSDETPHYEAAHDETPQDADAPTEAHEADGEYSFAEAGAEIIASLTSETWKRSRALYRPRAAEELHRLRIAAKRLRYAVELFALCLRDEAKNICQEISRLQDALGELHDCDVWLDELRAALDDDNHQDEAQRRAAVWLILYFNDKRARAFQSALARFEAWRRHGFRERLLQLADLELMSDK